MKGRWLFRQPALRTIGSFEISSPRINRFALEHRHHSGVSALVLYRVFNFAEARVIHRPKNPESAFPGCVIDMNIEIFRLPK
jgi:hypothetical protein